MVCRYCGLTPATDEHVLRRHGITPEQDAALRKGAKPAGVGATETAKGLTVPRGKASSDDGHRGYL